MNSFIGEKDNACVLFTFERTFEIQLSMFYDRSVERERACCILIALFRLFVRFEPIFFMDWKWHQWD